MSLIVSFDEIFEQKSGLLATHQTWRRIELGKVCKVINGFPFKSQYFNSTGKGSPIIRIRDLYKGETGTFYNGSVPEEFIVNYGDLLIGMDGIFRCCEWIGGPAGLNQRVCKIVPDDRFLDRKFFLFGINGYLKAIQDATSSVTVGHLSSLDILRIPFPLPPIAEQRRLVAHLEKVFGLVDDCKARQAKVSDLLIRFRQSIISAACSGRLTADWRKDRSLDDELPSGWKLRQLQELFPPGGIFDGPFGSNLKTSDYKTSGVRVIRLENVGRLRFKNERETYISQKKYLTLQRHTVSEGDIIFASFIDEEVRVCVLPRLETAAIAKADCFCLRPKPELVDRRYLTYQLSSQKSYDSLVAEVHGATRPRINTTQLRKLEIAVCPIDEQREIVWRIESLFSLADRIESRYKAVQQQVDRLPHSVLAKAFRGELVSTEAELAEREGRTYESAEQLLQRIRAARTELGVKKRSVQTKRRRKA